MANIQNDLNSISIDFLYIGMPVKDTIFNYNGKVALLAAGEEITEANLARLKKFIGENNTICVSKLTFKDLIKKRAEDEEIEREKNKHVKVVDKNYTPPKEIQKFHDEVGNFLSSVKDTPIITPTHVEKLHKSAMKRLDLVDQTDILKSVNMPKPMDKDLERHSTNISFLNGLFGKWLYLKDYQIRDLVLAGLLHDIGKTKIPDEILNAPRQLTDEEFKIIKTHPTHSFNLLELDKPEFNKNVLSGILHHHEKLDGTGYPSKLSGNQIDIFARITAITDVYDALISKRAYKDDFNPFHVCKLLTTDFASSLDNDLVKVFIQNISATLINSHALMSDNSIATIKRILPFDIEYPIVEKEGTYIMCNKDFYPIKLLNN